MEYQTLNIFRWNESTGISTNALIALEKAGFIVYKTGEGKNPSYEIKYSYNIPPVIARSKKYNDSSIPAKGFGTLIVCPNADAIWSLSEWQQFQDLPLLF
jgi:hypothetical protein